MKESIESDQDINIHKTDFSKWWRTNSSRFYTVEESAFHAYLRAYRLAFHEGYTQCLKDQEQGKLFEE